MSTSSVSLAVAALRRGGLVILPTETVYGLAADAGNAEAVADLFTAKGRPSFNPLIAHVSGLRTARGIADFDDRAQALARAFWPGPLTIVAPISWPRRVCDLATAGLDTVALRAPSHPLARQVLALFDGPVVAPSANLSGRPSPTTYADAMAETGAAAAASLDGGPCKVGIESTVVSVMPGEPMRLLRLGVVLRRDIEAIAGPLEDAGEDAHRSPGRLARHYAPVAPLRLDADAGQSGEVMIGFGPVAGDLNLSPTGDLGEAAANLFAMLRAADSRGPDGIAVAPIPAHGLGEAINDRLKRAAGFVG